MNINIFLYQDTILPPPSPICFHATVQKLISLRVDYAHVITCSIKNSRRNYALIFIVDFQISTFLLIILLSFISFLKRIVSI